MDAENAKFTPLRDFYDEELGSHYCVGLNYTVRPGNERLASKVEEWQRDAKVRLGTADGADSARAAVKGVGSVQ